jgi:hypothetical protein
MTPPLDGVIGSSDCAAFLDEVVLVRFLLPVAMLTSL